MRVLQVLAGADHGGAENYFIRLVIALKEAELSQHVVMKSHSLREQSLKSADIPYNTAKFQRLCPWPTTSTTVGDHRPTPPPKARPAHVNDHGPSV